MDDSPTQGPAALPGLRASARDAGFIMSSEDRTGSLLAALAAAREELGMDPRVTFPHRPHGLGWRTAAGRTDWWT